MQKIRVFFLIIGLATGALAQPTILPGAVKIGAAAGSTVAVSETVTLISSGTFGQNLDFDLSIQYGSSPQGWLSVSPVHGTTPTTFVITADPTNLPAGTYSAQVSATVGPLRVGALTKVSFTVAPAGSNPGGVAVSPSSLTFLGKSAATQTISVINAPGTSGALTFTAFANPSDELRVTQSVQTSPATLTVEPMTLGMSEGIHSGSITLTERLTGKSTVVPVTFVVPESTGGAAIKLIPLETALTFNYQLNSGPAPQQTVDISTNSTQYVPFTATVSTSWIQVSAANFLTPGSTASSLAPSQLFVTINPAGLAAGTYKGTITLTSPGLSSVDIPVTLTVSSSPVLNSNPSFVSFDDSANILSAGLAITGSSSFYFTVSVSAPWITVTPLISLASSSPVNLTVTPNLDGLPAGTYNGTITLTGYGGSPTLSIPVQLRKSSTTATGLSLKLTPESLKFSGIAGTEAAPQYVQIASTGIALTFTVAAVSDSGWLSVDPLSGITPMVVKVTANSAVPAGSYTGSLVFTSLLTGSQTTLPVTYDLTARTLTATPAALIFSQPAVGAALAPQQVQVTANAPSTFKIASQPTWAKVTTTTALSTPASLTVSVDPTGMAPGKYDGNIQLSGPNDVMIPVSLTIAAPAAPTVTPAAITFSYEFGSPPPPTQTIQIATPGRTVAFTGTASTVSGVNWLTVTPGTGSTPGTIVAGVNVTQLVPGQQTGSITVTLQDSAGTIATIPVTLTVTGSPIQVQSVVNAATWAPTSVAPGQIVTLTGLGLGPNTAAVGRPSAAGAYGTVLADVSVSFDQAAAPLLMVQNEQINAIVPYSLYGRNSAKLQVQSGSSYSIPIDVKVVDAAPGIFTVGNSGKFQAAALNGDFTPNSPLNPAQRGSVIVLYLTGEGQTDPPGQDGRVIASDLRKPLLPVVASIGGQAAEVLYAGSAPTMVSGLCQVNLRIPATLDPGTQPVSIQIGGIATQRGVTIEVY